MENNIFTSFACKAITFGLATACCLLLVVSTNGGERVLATVGMADWFVFMNLKSFEAVMFGQ